MKNKLIPIQQCSSNSGEWEPSPVRQGYVSPQLVDTDGALRIRTGKTQGAYHGFQFLTDLGGRVHHGGSLPVIYSPEVGTFFIQDPSDHVVAAFNEAKNAGSHDTRHPEHRATRPPRTTMSTIRIFSPEGSLPYTSLVEMANAETHVRANDQRAHEASLLLAYHRDDWAHWTETASGVTKGGIDWADYDYDHDSAKRSIRSWSTVATHGSTFPDEDGVGACDVEVQAGECGGRWYLRTCDDAGGSDGCDATPYDSARDAETAAKSYAAQNDECDELSAEAWLEREAAAAIEAAKSSDGEYVLVHDDGSRWDSDRYSDRLAAQTAVNRWHDSTQAANPGTSIIWHLMDCPTVGRLTEAGAVEILGPQL